MANTLPLEMKLNLMRSEEDLEFEREFEELQREDMTRRLEERAKKEHEERLKKDLLKQELIYGEVCTSSDSSDGEEDNFLAELKKIKASQQRKEAKERPAMNGVERDAMILKNQLLLSCSNQKKRKVKNQEKLQEELKKLFQ